MKCRYRFLWLHLHHLASEIEDSYRIIITLWQKMQNFGCEPVHCTVT